MREQLDGRGWTALSTELAERGLPNRGPTEELAQASRRRALRGSSHAPVAPAERATFTVFGEAARAKPVCRAAAALGARGCGHRICRHGRRAAGPRVRGGARVGAGDAQRPQVERRRGGAVDAQDRRLDGVDAQERRLLFGRRRLRGFDAQKRRRHDTAIADAHADELARSVLFVLHPAQCLASRSHFFMNL